MNRNEFEVFKKLWETAHAVSTSNQKPTTEAVSMSFEILIDYPLEAIQAAVILHAKNSKFAPTPSDICGIIEGSRVNKHLGADEAWAIAIESFNEEVTVIWTNEMAKARAIAWPIWESGDSVGARMAFKEAYNRIIDNSKLPEWQVSLGFDVKGRENALEKAVASGLLTKHQASAYLPAPRDGGFIGKMLAGKTQKPKENWQLGYAKQRLQEAVARREEKDRIEKQEYIDFMKSKKDDAEKKITERLEQKGESD